MGHKWGQSRGEELGSRSRGEAIKAILCAVHTLTGNRNENGSPAHGTGISFSFCCLLEQRTQSWQTKLELMLRMEGLHGRDSVTDN